VLVEFPPDWTAESSTSFDQTTITIAHENVRLYLIEVPEFNEILAEQREQAEDEKWAFIILDDYWLTKHQKYPRPRGVPADGGPRGFPQCWHRHLAMISCQGLSAREALRQG
jgi:hypothetical protein